MHGLVENKTILKFLCHNNVGEDNKSPQNILVIRCSFKALHNFVKTGNLEISSFLNGDWESSEFCMLWFCYGFLLTLLWRDKKDVARKNYCRGCSANLYGDHFFSSVILTSLCNSIAEVRINYRSSLFQKLVWSYNSYIKCQWNNQSPLDLFLVVSRSPSSIFRYVWKVSAINTPFIYLFWKSSLIISHLLTALLQNDFIPGGDLI